MGSDKFDEGSVKKLIGILQEKKRQLLLEKEKKQSQLHEIFSFDRNLMLTAM